ncbi:DUF7311 family protein [Halodesulfurarchaeum sp.]|uniref:DUF7311 family protein n=1 Tax=Halodesulfurarchaeum sp. TaxID=1980530 RepID=UPI002FC377BC
MSLRLLLAVVLAGALVAASMPAIQAAQRTQADRQLSTTVDDLNTAAMALVRQSDPVPPGVPAATRRVRVSLPDKPADAGITIGPPADGNTSGRSQIRTMVPGDPPGHTVLNETIRPHGPDGAVSWNDSLTVRESTELTLHYRRVDGTAVITVARGFK